MLAFNQFNVPVPKSARDHVQSQFNLMSELYKQMLSSLERVNQLNIQVAQSLTQESIDNAREVITAKDPYEAMSIAAGQVQPAAEKMRAYQQHLTDIAARTQVDLSRTAEKHVPETSRTAAAVADEVARMTTEATQKATQRQKETLDKLSTPLGRTDAGKAGGANVH